MTSFTIESAYLVSVFRHRTYEAATIEDACYLALEDDDWQQQKTDFESVGPTHVTGAWPGVDTAYQVPPVPIPKEYGRSDHKAPDRGLARRYAIGIIYLSDTTPFARMEFVVEEFCFGWAENLALERARDSVYFDPRIPDLGCAIASSQELPREADDPLLAQACRAFAGCLDDLDTWGTMGGGGYTAEERQRRDRYEVVLNRIMAEIRPPVRPTTPAAHSRFDKAFALSIYREPLQGPLRSFSVLVSIYSDHELIVQELYTIEAPNAVQAEHLAIDRSDYSPHWRATFDGMSRSAFATEIDPSEPTT